LLNRQIGGLVTLEYPARVDSEQPIILSLVASIADQAARFGELAILVDRRNRIAKRHRGKPLGAAIEERVGTDHERVGVKLGQGRKSFVEIAIGARLQPVELKSHDARGRLQLPHKNR